MENQNNQQQTGKTILVIEDETPLRLALINRMLKTGCRVLEAEDGEKGLTAALEHRPDLILLDIAMPKMDGFTLLDKLRENDWGKHAKVIILTNFDADDDKLTKVVSDQPAYYLMKSANTLDQILEKVQSVLNPMKEGEFVSQ